MALDLVPPEVNTGECRQIDEHFAVTDIQDVVVGQVDLFQTVAALETGHFGDPIVAAVECDQVRQLAQSRQLLYLVLVNIQHQKRVQRVQTLNFLNTIAFKPQCGEVCVRFKTLYFAKADELEDY